MPGNSTILPLTPTNFATIPTVPATSTTTTAPAPGAPIAGESTYTIQPGDYPSTIARKFGVKFQDLLALNGWTLVGQQVTNFPPPGTQIKIPAGATAPASGEAPSTATTAAGGDGTTSATTTTAGGAKPTTTAARPTTTGGACATGSYVITKDDTSRTKVAAKFDVTVDQLDAANANTKGYSAFYPGLKIIIPAKSGCT